MRKILLAALAAHLLTGTAYAARTDLVIGNQL